MTKKLFILRDFNDYDPIECLLVDSSLDSEGIQEEIDRIVIKKSKEAKGEWYVSEVLEALSFEYEVIEFESFYL